jgi:hypothetical protein
MNVNKKCDTSPASVLVCLGFGLPGFGLPGFGLPGFGFGLPSLALLATR